MSRETGTFRKSLRGFKAHDVIAKVKKVFLSMNIEKFKWTYYYRVKVQIEQNGENIYFRHYGRILKRT